MEKIREEIRCGACRKKLGEGQYTHLIIKCRVAALLNHLEGQEPHTRSLERLLKKDHHGSHHSLDWRKTPPRRAALERFRPTKCYVEVFAGGAAVFFTRNPADVEVLNDVNGDWSTCTGLSRTIWRSSSDSSNGH